MRPAITLLCLAGIVSGCASPQASTVLTHEGIYSAKLVSALSLEEYPLEKWSKLGRSGTDEQNARRAAFDSRKRTEWQAYVGLWTLSDTVYRITGGNRPALFEYFVIVREGKELRRFYVWGGDGVPAVE